MSTANAEDSIKTKPGDVGAKQRMGRSQKGAISHNLALQAAFEYKYHLGKLIISCPKSLNRHSLREQAELFAN